MCILGLLGLMDAHLITKIFITYIVVDTVWIVVSPSAVPKHAGALVLHHVLTFAILLHPLRSPSTPSRRAATASSSSTPSSSSRGETSSEAPR